MTKAKNPAKQRAPSESPPESQWGKSVGGTYFEIQKMTKRDMDGKKLYRLLYLVHEVLGNQEWTLDELLESGITFLKNKPSREQLDE